MPTADAIQDAIDKLMTGEDLTPGEARTVVRTLAPSQVRILAAALLTDVPKNRRWLVACAIDIAKSSPPIAD